MKLKRGETKVAEITALQSDIKRVGPKWSKQFAFYFILAASAALWIAIFNYLFV